MQSSPSTENPVPQLIFECPKSNSRRDGSKAFFLPPYHSHCVSRSLSLNLGVVTSQWLDRLPECALGQPDVDQWLSCLVSWSIWRSRGVRASNDTWHALRRPPLLPPVHFSKEDDKGMKNMKMHFTGLWGEAISTLPISIWGRKNVQKCNLSLMFLPIAWGG